MNAGKNRNKSKEDIKSIIGETYGRLGFDKLLRSAGVDTVQELANQNPEILYEELMELNNEKGLVMHQPSLEEVRELIQKAEDQTSIDY